jgi:uncharacterized membrane protein YphA (DoxX/SURF4 family)
VDTVLWILQIMLALAFVAIGLNHILNYERASQSRGTQWMAAVGKQNMRIIGLLELLGAVGLILPAVTGILPWLTPLAAAMLALLMAFAIVFHARRPGEVSNIAFNAILGVVAVIVAVGRFLIEPF